MTGLSSRSTERKTHKTSDMGSLKQYIDLYEQQRQKLIKRFELAIAGMEKNTAGIGLPALGLYREILADLERLG